MPGTPTPAPRRHRALATSTPTPLWPHPSCSRRQSQLRLLHLIARPNPAASASLLPHLPSSPCLPTLCRGHRGQVGGLPRAGAWMHPLPYVFLLPTGSPQRARQEGGRATALSAKNSLAAGHLRSTEGKPFFLQTIAQVPSRENSRPAFSPGSLRQALCHQQGLDQRERAKGEGLTFKSGQPPQPWAGPEAMRSS